MGESMTRADLLERIARAWEDDVYPTVGVGRDNKRAVYVRRRNEIDSDDFEPIAGPFATDGEAETVITRMHGEAILAAIHDAGCAVVPRMMDDKMHVHLMIHADVKARVAEIFPAMVAAADLAKESG